MFRNCSSAVKNCSYWPVATQLQWNKILWNCYRAPWVWERSTTRFIIRINIQIYQNVHGKFSFVERGTSWKCWT